MRRAVIVSCEHATNHVPRRWAALFAGHARLLDSHRGWDRGALELARRLAAALDAPLVAARQTRLLIDANRTLRRRSLFSTVTWSLLAEERRSLIRNYLEPHHRAVAEAVQRCVDSGASVVHVAAHTFAPVVRGVRRLTDVGLLYDPARPAERFFCSTWKKKLRAIAPRLRVRRNYPFLGKNDGLTAKLRRRFDDPSYLGIELELNQRLYSGAGWRRVIEDVITALRAALGAAPM